MAAPKGNKYGRGKKGRSGRKSLAYEANEIEMLREAFFSKTDVKELKQLIEGAKGQKRSAWDIVKAKVLAGDDKWLEFKC